MSDNLLIGGGCLSLGLLVGGVIAHFIASAKEFNLRALTSVVAVIGIGGAGLLGLFKYLGGPATAAYWWYPIGLMFGTTIIALLRSKFADRNLIPGGQLHADGSRHRLLPLPPGDGEAKVAHHHKAG